MIRCPYLESYTDGDFCTLYHKICDMSCCIAWKNGGGKINEDIKI